MAKDDKKIHSSVRLGGTVYHAGMEDQLHGVLDKDQVTRLTESGAISGFDAKADKAAAKAEEAEPAEAEEAPAETTTKTKGSK